MIHVTENKFQELVRENARGVGEAKQRVICEHRPEPHCSCVQDSLMTKTAQTAMAVNNLNTFTYKYVSEDGEEGEDSRKCGLSVDDEKGHMVHLESIGKIADTLSIIM